MSLVGDFLSTFSLACAAVASNDARSSHEVGKVSLCASSFTSVVLSSSSCKATHQPYRHCLNFCRSETRFIDALHDADYTYQNTTFCQTTMKTLDWLMPGHASLNSSTVFLSVMLVLILKVHIASNISSLPWKKLYRFILSLVKWTELKYSFQSLSAMRTHTKVKKGE